MKPEELTVVNCAGGCLDYRIRIISDTEVHVEQWHISQREDAYRGDMDEDVDRRKTFATTAEAWQWVGEQLYLLASTAPIVVPLAFEDGRQPPILFIEEMEKGHRALDGESAFNPGAYEAADEMFRIKSLKPEDNPPPDWNAINALLKSPKTIIIDGDELPKPEWIKDVMDPRGELRNKKDG